MVSSIIAFILLVGTVGIGLTCIARSTEQQPNLEEVTEKGDQVAASHTLLP